MAIPFEQLEGKYEILEKMREGGMGAVYRVRHRLLDEIRVIKVMRPHLAEDEVLRARFLREAKTAIRLRHANLAQIYDFTVDEQGFFFLVMEFIDGLNLQELIRAFDHLSISMALEIAHQSLGVLGYLHRKEIVHRDISPDNLLLTRDDEGSPLVKLIDLGIAKIQESDENLTATGTFLGKVRYSSPEHFHTKDSAEVGPHSDLYSFGIVLYEMLTGKYPIKGSNISSLIAGHLVHEPLPFAESDPDGRVPEELRAAILRVLDKKADVRFPSARAFRTKIGELRRQHPLNSEEIERVFDDPCLPTMQMPVVKPGSTQSHLDRNFGIATTPPHGKQGPRSSEIESVGTMQTPQPGATPATDKAAATQRTSAAQQQVRALLLGAEKLVLGHHYDEARLQLNSALSMDPKNQEAGKLLEALDAADTRLKARRAEAQKQVQEAIAAAEFANARALLDSAIQRLGVTGKFKALGTSIDEAETAAKQREEQIADALESIRELLDKEDFESAVKTINQVLELDPERSQATTLLQEAEAGVARQREAQRRAQEIQKTAAAISGHLAQEDFEGARRSLALARKLYGAEADFDALKQELEELRERLRLRHADGLCAEAEGLIEGADFDAATRKLQEALTYAPGSQKATDLLAAANEGLRLEAEAKKRDRAISKAALSIERLILAGRLETAYRSVDASVKTFGDFEQAAALRSQIKGEITARKEFEARAQALVDAAVEAADAGDFDAAESSLQAAREIAEERPETQDLVEEVDEQIAVRAEAHRRNLAIAEAAQSIEQGLLEGDIDGATRELGVAERLYGDEEVLTSLREKLAEIERRHQKKRAEALVREALAKQTSFSEVIAKLEEALSLVPGNEKVQRLLAETRGAQQRYNQEQRAKAITDAMVRVDELIASGKLEKALETVSEIVETLGDFKEARIITFKLSKALADTKK